MWEVLDVKTRVPDVEAGLVQTAVLASHGMYTQALFHLRHTERVLSARPQRVDAANTAAFFASEIERLRRLISEDATRREASMPPA